MTAAACKRKYSHGKTEVHTCSEGVCVTAHIAWVETNNLHSHYTRFYVQEFVKRYMAVGETFLSLCPPPHLQFCEMDTDNLTPSGQHPALHSSSPCAPDMTHHCFGCGQLCSSSALLIVAVISLIFLRSYGTTSPQDLPTDSHPYFSVFQLLFSEQLPVI